MSDLGNKEIFSKNLKFYMNKENIDRNIICEKLDLKYSTFSDWYNGNKYPRIDKIELLANFLRIEKSDLIENHDTPYYKSIRKTVKIPVLGKVSAGIPITANQEVIEYEELDIEMANTGTFFGLKVKGDSMFPYYMNNDTVIIKKQDYCDNGNIAVVLINGDEAVVKRVLINDNGMTLQSYNPTYDPMVFTKKDIKDLPIIIVGIVKKLIRNEN